MSAQGSPRELKLAPASPMVARVLSRSLVDRARRSSFVTSTMSPGSSERRHRASAARSVLMPDCFSAEDQLRSSGLEQLMLRSEVLPISADASVALDHFAAPFCA